MSLGIRVRPAGLGSLVGEDWKTVSVADRTGLVCALLCAHRSCRPAVDSARVSVLERGLWLLFHGRDGGGADGPLELGRQPWHCDGLFRGNGIHRPRVGAHRWNFHRSQLAGLEMDHVDHRDCFGCHFPVCVPVSA